VQLVAPAADHVSVAVCPTRTLAGDTLIVTVGAQFFLQALGFLVLARASLDTTPGSFDAPSGPRLPPAPVTVAASAQLATSATNKKV
jgi:hypothetical protein